MNIIGWLATKIFNFKAKAVMLTAAMDPRFKSALEAYAKGTQEFREKLRKQREEEINN